MWQIIGIFVVAAIAVVALKLAIGVLFLAGLIFKPKETVTLLLILGTLALVRNYPVICWTIIGISLLVAFAKLSKGGGDPPKLSG